MFKKPLPTLNKTQVKSSVQRQLKVKLNAALPNMGQIVEQLMPKQEKMQIAKFDAVQLALVFDRVVFFNSFDGPWVPTLKALHMCLLNNTCRYPQMLPMVTVDTGAIKFVLRGAGLLFITQI
jgi:PUA domain protein